jgi:glycosyltransferase involved in cell wall biosynthesis
VICALNEQKIIAKKASKTAWPLEYPKEKLRIHFGRSTDDTNDILREYEARGVQLIEQEWARKGRNLNETLAAAAGGYLGVFRRQRHLLPDATAADAGRGFAIRPWVVTGKVIAADTKQKFGDTH